MPASAIGKIWTTQGVKVFYFYVDFYAYKAWAEKSGIYVRSLYSRW